MAGRLQRSLNRRIVRDWLWLGRCPVCGTSVLVDDEFVRTGGSILHAECDRYRVEACAGKPSERPGQDLGSASAG
jgi:hypothetical protein